MSSQVKTVLFECMISFNTLHGMQCFTIKLLNDICSFIIVNHQIYSAFISQMHSFCIFLRMQMNKLHSAQSTGQFIYHNGQEIYLFTFLVLSDQLKVIHVTGKS